MNLSHLATAIGIARKRGARRWFKRKRHYVVFLSRDNTPLAASVTKNGKIGEVYSPISQKWLGGPPYYPIAGFNVLAEFKPDE